MKNELFFGRPDYVGPDSGYGAFLHHDVLFEKSHSFKERLDYIDREKPEHERHIRRWNMLYLPFVDDAWMENYLAKCDALDADYEAKRAPLDADYEAKRAPLDADILAYIKTHIPDCSWDGKELVFG